MPQLSAILDDRPGRSGAVPIGIRRSTTYLPELESLRGIAILLVYFFHLDGLIHFLVSDRPLPSLPLSLVRAGNTGVDLFFVLSGFLLGFAFVTEAHGGRPIELRHYFARRALRILPLYWTTVLVVTVMASEHAGDLLRAIPYLLFFNMTIGWEPIMFPHSTVWWSLGTEMQFYLTLPGVRWLLRPGTGRWAAVGALLAYGGLYATAVIHSAMHPAPGGSWIWSSLFGRLPGFLFGVFGAWGYFVYGEDARSRMHASRWMRNGGADGLLLGVLLLMTPILRQVVRIGFKTAEVAPFQAYHVATSALWAAFVGLVLVAPIRTRRLLHNRVLGALGIISYSIYLWHVPIVHLSLMALRSRWPRAFHAWDVPTTIGTIGITIVTFAAAGLSYRFIERPFLAYKSRLGG